MCLYIFMTGAVSQRERDWLDTSVMQQVTQQPALFF